jgi:hypothetical protein
MFFRLLECSKNHLLEKRSFNITKHLGHIIKVFEDFRLVQQIREEIEKVKPCIVL